MTTNEPTGLWQRIDAAARAPATRRTDVARWTLAAGLTGMTVAHLVAPRPFEAMIPDYLPGTPTMWNLLGTAGEGVSAALLWRRRTAALGGWTALATLTGVYLANIQAALDGGMQLKGFAGTATAAWLRLPLQWPMQWLAYRIARADHATADSGGPSAVAPTSARA